MGKKQKKYRPKARLPKGMRDVGARELHGLSDMLARVQEVYEAHGFDLLDTPAFEYTDALGKFLPDQDRPNEGVFSLQDDDGQWLSLRYDLTAPLARYVAEHYDALPKPFRRCQWGPVWRNEKPGPGRFRQFIQFDADTVGTASLAADAELCMLAADCLEKLGIPRGDYVMRVNNRKILDGVLETIGIGGEEHTKARLTVLRAIDKLDKFGSREVRLLLGEGRRDVSGDFTTGAGLKSDQIDLLMEFIEGAETSALKMRQAAEKGDLFNSDIDQGYFDPRPGGTFYNSDVCIEGHSELEEIRGLVRANGYGMDRIIFDPSIVRGLEYYTGPVFEAELMLRQLMMTAARFGSVRLAVAGAMTGWSPASRAPKCRRPVFRSVSAGFMRHLIISASSPAARRSRRWWCWRWIGTAWPVTRRWRANCATPESGPKSISAPAACARSSNMLTGAVLLAW